MRASPVPSAFRVHLTAISKSPSTRIVKVGIRAQSSAADVPIAPEQPRHKRPSDKLTIFTQPRATKRSVLEKIRSKLSVGPSEPGQPERAAVVLASPRHASWLTENGFTAELVHALHGPFEQDEKFHLLAAVVDGLCARSPSRELQEGISIHVGRLDGLLPGLWDTTSPADEAQSLSRSLGDSELPSNLSILLPQKMTRKDARISVTLPLANTLFSNGRRSTLLASEWTLATGFSNTRAETVRTVEKRTQVIDLPASILFDKVDMRAPLVPITQPRKILEGLGNILAKVEVAGEPQPASMELQTNIHRLFYRSLQGRYLGSALGKLAFEMSTDSERLAWENETVLRNAFFEGARLHKILGGGGEWGAKASLLSLDPKTSHTPQSEADELDKFMRSFHGEENAKDSIAQPGDFVQFFVERDGKQMPPERHHHLKARSDYPPVKFGCGDMHMGDIDRPDSIIMSRRVDRGHTEQLYFDHFGAHSAEGIYVSSGEIGPNTKIDVPGASVSMTTVKGSEAAYRPFVRLYQHREKQ
ncbi:hypothetical protein J7T55_008484 [Diaporthe amygdali]|uniref:uncharacterized protein n=1 Tax=Phomopsis amygdali TaxID=1214568 RepID=UPI0022FDDDB7|nr:uncharacterized protein J7T55_008484 [Diaporthe amygdali]KAJ0121320.1 hypothetical protein J7T55_008484 [Diaporthe amygdali]